MSFRLGPFGALFFTSGSHQSLLKEVALLDHKILYF
jgi:hypothetical protein